MTELITLPGNKTIRINRNAKEPNSGKTFAYTIDEYVATLNVGTVLDIGAGYYGILGSEFAKYGWNVDLLEYNHEACLHLRKEYPYPADIIEMDVRKYSISAKRYDVIISNPAQMPSFSDTCDWNHDVAGYDGTSMIYRICDIAKIGLKEQGQLILLVFGFLLPKVKSYLSDIGFIMLRDMPMIKQCSPSGKILSSVSLNRHLYPEFDWDNVVQTHTLPTSILFARRGNA